MEEVRLQQDFKGYSGDQKLKTPGEQNSACKEMLMNVQDSCQGLGGDLIG